MALPESPTVPIPVVAIVGGAVAGSEAAAVCARHGAIAVVFEQGTKPYGKIEDGLPRWHEKLRHQEYAKIDENLSNPRVLFVPKTSIGRDVSFETLVHDLGFSAVLLANGAWRDRPLGIPGVDAYVGKGLAYQNAFVQWFNHYHEPGYEGPGFEVHDRTIVVGGGLASVDVAKIVNLELYARALRKRGIEVDVVQLEIDGIPETLKKYGIAQEELGIHGCTLVYRRRKQDMPLAAVSGSSPEQIAKAENARVKIMERVERKYAVRFEGLASPVAPIVDGDRLVGLRCLRNRVEGRGVEPVAGSEFELRGPMVISSIGSVPYPIPGVPTKGELYDYEDFTTGRIRGVPHLFGLGNVLTGKGNIRDSRENAEEVASFVIEDFLGVADEGEPEGLIPDPALETRESVRRILEAVIAERTVEPETARRILDFVKAWWDAIEYPGSYRRYLESLGSRG